MSGIEAGEVFQAGHVGQVVEGNELEIEGSAALIEGTQHAATDAAVTVEGDAIGTGVGHGSRRSWRWETAARVFHPTQGGVT
ncbi:hypothetical protein ACRS34_03985 [Stutzerimonas stutzeri]|uniref:hypothetical protein n=1 Tax=Stutzerimonas stutzeri TaxID=316 RepID=UPI003EE2977F